ncbi:MAG TPA: alpha/beta hydrolase [Thermoanaerobaculaceae bacterium]|nr:alpha/beta hydrolase [Thermoanaerobaculaceae bacterium]
MTMRVTVLVAVLAAVAVVGGWLGWMTRYRPLTVFAWQTRFALRSAGLRKVRVTTSVGQQAAFIGGHGPFVVLLHGAGDNAGTWFRVVPELLKGHTLIVPDLAGHGDSEPRSGPIEVSQVIAGAEAVLDRLAPGQRVALVGNSLGAWAAMVLAKKQPERVAVCVCIDGGAIKGSNVHARILPATQAEARESVAQTRDPASAPVPAFVLDDIVRQAKVGSLARFAATASTMETYVLDDTQLRELTVPVRIIWGASDRLVPLDYAQRMLAKLPNATLVTLERCGHVPQIECPRQLIPALKETLGGSGW